MGGLEGFLDFLETGFLEAHVVVVVHRVDADDMDVIDGVEQLFGEVGSDESGYAGEENGLSCEVDVVWEHNKVKSLE